MRTDDTKYHECFGTWSLCYAALRIADTGREVSMGRQGGINGEGNTTESNVSSSSSALETS